MSINQMTSNDTFTCPSCGEKRVASKRRHGEIVPVPVAKAIQHSHPGWLAGMDICLNCINEGKADYMADMMEAEMGELSEMDQEVLDSIRRDSLLALEMEEEAEQDPDLGKRRAAGITAAIASWGFLLVILALLLVWIMVNVLFRPFEPYPVVIFAVISAVLATLAALEAPIIMMSQRTQQERDRERARNEYKVNLKAELEIRILDEKTDMMLMRQRELMARLVAYQERPINDDK
jgi:uncharacterized membrane protein